MKGILRYISTNESHLSYKYADRTTAESNITAWIEASFVDDASTKKSTIGNLINWNNYIIAWDSGTTKNVVLSTYEAEFIAASVTMRNSLYLKNFNDEILGYPSKMLLKIDNQSCVKWLKNETGYKSKTKHISIQCHFVREICSSGQMMVFYIPTTEQIADIFTKSLSSNQHVKLMDLVEKLSSSGGV